MIVRNATDLSAPVLFSSGHPDGDVAWTLSDDVGVITSGTVTPALDDVSVILTIPALLNTLTPGAYFAPRYLSWAYLVGGATVAGELSYTLEARLPLGITPAGVRAKLGVNEVDLPDRDIPLVAAYLSFEEAVSPTVLSEAFNGGLTDIRIRDAVEAQAALAVLPGLQVRIAKSEDSGTNKFQRQTIDWNAVGQYLTDLVSAGLIAVVPTYDPTVGYGDIFILASPATDAVTGS